MPTLSDKEKQKRERSECIKAWNIVRKLPDYKKDFKAQNMRNPPKQDRKITKTQQKFSDELEQKWGFYPLQPPTEKLPDLEFLSFFGDYSKKVSRFNSAVDFEGLDLFYRKGDQIFNPNGQLCKIKKLPSKISVTLDLTSPQEVIIKELRETLPRIRKLLAISKKNTSSHDHLEFLVQLFKKQGLSDAQIQKKLRLKDISAYLNPSESLRKKISRRLPRT